MKCSIGTPVSATVENLQSSIGPNEKTEIIGFLSDEYKFGSRGQGWMRKIRPCWSSDGEVYFKGGVYIPIAS